MSSAALVEHESTEDGTPDTAWSEWRVSLAPVTAPVLQRFMEKVVFLGGHWLWTGPQGHSRGGAAYGRFSLAGSQRAAHRLAYQWWVGPLRPADHVRHTCNLPLCVNPDHLRAGSHANNMQDRDRAGRTARGERQGHAKLTEGQVRTILAAQGTPSEIGRRFGLSRSHVANIRAGRIWRHVAVTTPTPRQAA